MRKNTCSIGVELEQAAAFDHENLLRRLLVLNLSVLMG